MEDFDPEDEPEEAKREEEEEGDLVGHFASPVCRLIFMFVGCSFRCGPKSPCLSFQVEILFFLWGKKKKQFRLEPII